jgi:hypothetical protein
LGDPRVAVLPGSNERIFVTPDTLSAGEAVTVLERLHEAFTTNRHNEKETNDVA